ncbi:MAG: prepilin-type N-terminal cleavage/methylation domain-containing protein [Acidimicrobiales bacterium]|jgi:prepilin-type N-terminal cleavage/methylation domain-containing protein
MTSAIRPSLPERLRARLGDRHRDDAGMTLIEVMVTSTILVVILGMVFVSMNLIESLSASVSAQYNEVDQVIPALAPIRSLLASEVEPAPQSSTGIPTPGFGVESGTTQNGPYMNNSVGNFGLTFFANVGTNYGNTVGASSSCGSSSCTAGPAEIVAEEIDPATGNEVTSSSSCTPSTPCNFQVRMYLPEVGNMTDGISSCPVNVNGTTPGFVCLYPTNYRLIANIQDVVNDPSGSGQFATPIFTYTIEDPNLGALTLTSSEVSQQAVTGLPGGSSEYTGTSQPFSTCNSATAGQPVEGAAAAGINCPLDAIQSVGIDLLVDEPGSGTNGWVNNQLIIYRYPQSINAECYPFQFINPGCDPYQSSAGG